MKIKLPFFLKSYDDRWHRAILYISLDTTHQEELSRAISSMDMVKIKEENIGFEKRKAGGLRKCPGHKNRSVLYDKDGQCSLCKGYKKA